MSNSQIIEQPTNRPAITSGVSDFDLLLILGGFGVLLILAAIFGQGRYRGDKLSGGARWANRAEVDKSNRRAMKQIRANKYNKFGLLLDRQQGIYLANLTQSLGIIGGAGYGKTQSGIQPLIHSALDQGCGGIVYDVKEDLIREHAMEAMKKGYQCYFFAPGKPYTDQINLLDFLRDALDTGGALQLAQILHLNLKPRSGTGDPFFDSNGDAALQAAFMMAKAMAFRDIVQAFEVLKLPGFVKRLHHASISQSVSPWISSTAAAIIQGIESPETVGSILSTAVTYFSRLIAPDLLPCLLKSTIPLDFDERTLIFVVPDKERMASTAPLCAAFIHMMVLRNFRTGIKRKKPCFISLDEFPTLRLPDAHKWLALNRSAGQSTWLSFQSESQLEEEYGRYKAKILLDNMGTVLNFNPGKNNLPIADKLSRICGQKRIKVENHGRTRGRGSTRNVNVSQQREPLIAPEDILAFQEGEVIIQSPALKYPYHVQLSEDQRYAHIQDDYAQQWEDRLKPQLVKRNLERLPNVEELERRTMRRRFDAELNLPHPDEFSNQETQALPQIVGAT